MVLAERNNSYIPIKGGTTVLRGEARDICIN